MSRKTELMAIGTLAQLVLDRRLSELREAANRLERSRGQLAALNAPTTAVDLPPVSAGMAEVGYQRWADIRRAELNAVMARQSAALIEARSEAATALGRVQATGALVDRLGKQA